MDYAGLEMWPRRPLAFSASHRCVLGVPLGPGLGPGFVWVSRNGACRTHADPKAFAPWACRVAVLANPITATAWPLGDEGHVAQASMSPAGQPAQNTRAASQLPKPVTCPGHGDGEATPAQQPGRPTLVGQVHS